MKKILTFTLSVIICFYAGVVQAVEPETVDVVKKALDITAIFDKPLHGSNEEMARAFYTECRGAYDSLYNFLQTKQKKEQNGHIIEFLPSNDRACVYYAANIIALRVYSLADYIIAVEAYKKNQIDVYQAMWQRLRYDLQQAYSYRQGFTATFGF